MEFRDLKRQYAALKPEIDAALLGTAAAADFISGKAVTTLEQRLASYVGRTHCVACANGTDALELVLKAWDIQAGDAVFVPDFTFFATAEVVPPLGATPIFVDVCGDTFNLDAKKLDMAVEAVKKAGKLRPCAVITVDLFGQPADYEAIEAVAKKHGLMLFEDAAQGFGGDYRGRKAGHFGEAAITSFFPAKPLGCYGDGGAIFTDDGEKAALIRSLTVHGKGSHKYENIRIGRNSRLDTIQAAILHVKMDAFEAHELEDVNQAAALYTQKLRALGVRAKTPSLLDGTRSSWAQYTIQLEAPSQRAQIVDALKAQGIPTMIYYPSTLRNQPAFADIAAYQVDPCQTSRSLAETVLSLPLHPYITTEEMDAVCRALAEFPAGKNA